MNSAGRILRRVVGACGRHPRLTVVVAIGLALGSIWAAWARLSFEASQLHLLPRGQSYVSRYQDYSREFGELDEIIIVVRGRSMQESQRFAARLAADLEAGPIAFNHLAYRVSGESLKRRALLYLPVSELRELRDRVFDRQAFMESFVASPGLVNLVESTNRQLAEALVGNFFDLGLQDNATTLGDFRFIATLLSQLRDAIMQSANGQTPWPAVLPIADPDPAAGYFLSDDERLLFILADPVGGSGGFTNDRAAIQEIRASIARLRTAFPEVEAGVTGGPALSNDEMLTAFEDSRLATALAFALTLGLLLIAFRRLREPLVMLGVLTLSLVWSVGLTALTVGHLTVFSVMFISIVIGLGIDYGIYVLFRWDEELALGAAPVAALEVMAARTGPGVLLGVLTAAATFYALIATDFHGVQELGFIAGSALLASFVAMLTVFPALLVLLPPRRLAVTPKRDATIVELVARHPTAVLAAAGVLTVCSLWSVRTVGFDYNLLHLQANDAESVVWERRIIESQGRSSFAGLDSATSLAELERKHAAFKQLTSVSSVDSALLFIPGDQPEKLKIVQDFEPLVAPLRLGPVPRLSMEALMDALERLERRLELASAGTSEGSRSPLTALRAQLADVLRLLRTGDPAEARAMLERYQHRLAGDFGEKLRLLQENLEPRRVTLADVPAEVRRKFVSANGRLLIRINPKVDVWDREGSTRFVQELRSVEPGVTGAPVIGYESIRRMEDAYRRGTLYALILVSVISAAMIRRVRETALALTPLVLGPLWALGLLNLFGFQLNLANVWGVPLIVGASAEYGLNIVTRAMEAGAYGGPPLARSTTMAVTFNGLTTISGFGSLMVAHHQGIWSLGLLLTCGSLASLIAALVVLPVLMRLFGGGLVPAGGV